MAAITIEVDHREASAATVPVLRACPDFSSSFTHLGLGDYRVGGALLFERKTLPDLVASIISGRLFAQAVRLANSPLRKAIILEGAGKEMGQSAMQWESVQGALVAVALFYGIPLLRTRTPEETVQTMLFAARQACAVATGALPRAGYRPRGKHARQLYILQGFPGIGPERARKLLAHFGSIEKIVTASDDDLAAVPGIGDQLVKRFRWAIEEPSSAYAAVAATSAPSGAGR